MLRDAPAIVDTALPDILPNAQHRLGMGRCCFHSCCLACQLLQDFHQADEKGLRTARINPSFAMSGESAFVIAYQKKRTFPENRSNVAAYPNSRNVAVSL